MSTVMGNAPADADEQAPTQDAQQPAAAPGENVPDAPKGRTCANCGSALAPDQDWCTQCGAGAPGSIHNPPWRSTTAIAAAVAALALGAAAAAYAALNEHTPARATVTKTVALASVPATPPATTTPKTALPATPGTTKLPIPLIKTKLPKIPLPAITTPKTTKTQPASKTPATANSESKEGAGKSESTSGTEASKTILLDTNAATTYNPYNLPASYFGDPSLTIDGDTSTTWSAEVDPATAPNMAEGVLLDLKSPQKVSVLKLVTQTPGMTVQVYGSTATTPPNSIVDPEWTPLSAPRVVAKHTTKFKLRDQKKGVRYITLWISKAPTSAVGTPEAPAHVLVNELELFPAS